MPLSTLRFAKSTKVRLIARARQLVLATSGGVGDGDAAATVMPRR
jgi:hypothetical protein